jgi:hypothetical protein
MRTEEALGIVCDYVEEMLEGTKFFRQSDADEMAEALLLLTGKEWKSIRSKQIIDGKRDWELQLVKRS